MSAQIAGFQLKVKSSLMVAWSGTAGLTWAVKGSPMLLLEHNPTDVPTCASVSLVASRLFRREASGEQGSGMGIR